MLKFLADYVSRNARVRSDQERARFNETKIISLRAELHHEALIYRIRSQELPAIFDTLEEEIKEIERLLLPGDRIADAILALPVSSVVGRDCQAAALHWKRGDYVAVYLEAGR